MERDSGTVTSSTTRAANRSPTSGGGSGGLGRFKYSTQADGSVSVTLDNADAAQDASLYTPLSRMMTFAGGELSGLGIDGQGLKMNRADEGMEHVLMTTWHGLLHGGSGDAEDYNINDKTFTSSNWREQQTIYIYDGSGSENDAKNRAGYTLINLPWNSSAMTRPIWSTRPFSTENPLMVIIGNPFSDGDIRMTTLSILYTSTIRVGLNQVSLSISSPRDLRSMWWYK